MIKHFTATVYIVEEEKFLFVFHPKFKKWLPPGGHLEPNETPIDAARREVYEETGLEVEWIYDERVSIDYPNAKNTPRPFVCLLEEVAPFQDEPGHQHIDLIYLAKPRGTPTSSPSHLLQWFTLSEINALSEEIFPDTKEMARSILGFVAKEEVLL